MNHIFLYGPPGSGKSTVGQLLAKSLNLEFINLDTEIETFSGQPIPQIMDEWGESGFRDVEAAAFKRVIKGGDKVIALGGGTLLRSHNRTRAEANGVVIFLETKFKVLMERLLRDEVNTRPLLAGELETELAALLDRRAEHYKSFYLRVSTNDKTPAAIVRDIQFLLGRFHVRGMSAGYDILVQRDGFDSLPELLRTRDLGAPVCIVTDENVAPLYGDRLLTVLRRAGFGYGRPHMITLPAGEEQKNLDSLSKLWRRFIEAGLDRKSTVLALGGGVIGDMSGFAAATFMRGIPWVNVPTTLLAMVDAAIGGKTGIDLPEGKNLIGSFHPPRLVLINPQLLATLPLSEIHSGLAEVLKHGLVADPDLFAQCAKGFEVIKPILPEIICRALAVKVDVIEKDPFEQNIRAALNLGHTVGHAVELVSGFRIKHGEAVAIGLVAEARLAERLGLAQRGLSEAIEDALRNNGLPTEIPEQFAHEELIHAMLMDKKRAAGVVRFALPVKVGEVKVGVAVDDLNLLFEAQQ
jgi:3-dehydroquinate synthase